MILWTFDETTNVIQWKHTTWLQLGCLPAYTALLTLLLQHLSHHILSTMLKGTSRCQSSSELLRSTTVLHSYEGSPRKTFLVCVKWLYSVICKGVSLQHTTSTIFGHKWLDSRAFIRLNINFFRGKGLAWFTFALSSPDLSDPNFFSSAVAVGSLPWIIGAQIMHGAAETAAMSILQWLPHKDWVRG